MSVQACRIRGFGYMFDFKEPLFSFIKGADDDWIFENEQSFIDVLGLEFSYYRMYDTSSNTKKAKLMVVTDGMNGEFKAVLYVTQVIDLYDTSGCHEQGWIRDFRNDDYIREYAKQNIETFLQRKLDREPRELDFEYYS